MNKYILILLLFLNALVSQAQNNETIDVNLLKNYEKVYDIVKDYIYADNMDGLLEIGSYNFKQSFNKDSLQATFDAFKNYCAKYQFKTFEAFHNASVKNEDNFNENGSRYTSRIYLSIPTYFKDSIAPILTNKIGANLALKLAQSGDFWLIESIKFKEIDFDYNYNIEQHIADFFIAEEPKYTYSTSITIYKKEHFKLVSLGVVNDFDLKIVTKKRTDLSDSSFIIDDEHYSAFLIQRLTKSEDSETEKNKPVYNYIELIFTNTDQVLISDASKYGLYYLKKSSNLADYLKRIVDSFVNNGYR
ncbi:MAG: hypothetical protein ACWA5P_07615 [bacterium]